MCVRTWTKLLFGYIQQGSGVQHTKKIIGTNKKWCVLRINIALIVTAVIFETFTILPISLLRLVCFAKWGHQSLRSKSFFRVNGSVVLILYSSVLLTPNISHCNCSLPIFRSHSSWANKAMQSPLGKIYLGGGLFWGQLVWGAQGPALPLLPTPLSLARVPAQWPSSLMAPELLGLWYLSRDIDGMFSSHIYAPLNFDFTCNKHFS